jgi:FMNH2-dependent dimethyl sulfone monooxygenase
MPADGPAVERLMQLQGLPAQSFPPTTSDALRVQFSGGHGVYPLLGDPDFIAQEIARIHHAGYADATLAFVDYAAALPYLVAEVLPRLVARGRRSA